MDIKLIYKNCFPKVKDFVIKNNGSLNDAKDIFQEAVTICWYNYSKGKQNINPNKFDAYIYSIARNKWIDHLRKNKKNPIDNHVEFVENLEDETIDFFYIEEKIEKLLFTFQQIGDKCKDILLSYYYKKQHLDKIAERYSTNSNVIKTQKSRCMKKLKELMYAN